MLCGRPGRTKKAGRCEFSVSILKPSFSSPNPVAGILVGHQFLLKNVLTCVYRLLVMYPSSGHRFRRAGKDQQPSRRSTSTPRGRLTS
jgi:hypothetical protein